MGDSLTYPVLTIALTALLALDAVTWGILSYFFRRSLKHIRNVKADPAEGVRYSIVIPCRNCSDTLAKVIKSIDNQVLKPLKTVIVDDGSTDDSALTAAVAGINTDLNIALIRIENVPDGWVPKTYACYKGYLVAKDGSDVIVFIDSDTWFTSPDSSLLLVNEALRAGLASYAPRFTCRTIACRAIESILTTFSHSLTGFHIVFNPRSRLSWFYGCCWAVRRDVYEGLGTHEAVRNSLVEDRDLAVRAKRLGLRFSIIRGFDKVESLWHDSVADTANVLIRIFWRSICREPVKAAITSALMIIPYMFPLIGLLISAALRNAVVLIASSVTYAVYTYTHSLGARLNRYSPLYSFIAPFIGAVLMVKFSSLALKKAFKWRGRTASEVLRWFDSANACGD